MEVAPGEPAGYDGRRVCAVCNKPGRPGDAQHPVGAPSAEQLRDPLAADERELTERILGERDEDDEALLGRLRAAARRCDPSPPDLGARLLAAIEAAEQELPDLDERDTTS